MKNPLIMASSIAIGVCVQVPAGGPDCYYPCSACEPFTSYRCVDSPGFWSPGDKVCISWGEAVVPNNGLPAWESGYSQLTISAPPMTGGCGVVVEVLSVTHTLNADVIVQSGCEEWECISTPTDPKTFADATHLRPVEPYTLCDNATQDYWHRANLEFDNPCPD